MMVTVQAGLVLLSAGVLACAGLRCLGQEPAGAGTGLVRQEIPRIPLEHSVDDTLIQAELGRLGGVMADRGQLLLRSELLKKRLSLPLELPMPSTTPLDDTDLAARCKAAVVVVARMARLGATNAWVALPASGFFITTSGAFVTSSHVIHDLDYEGIVVLTGDGRVLPVRGVIANDENCDVAILKADGGPVAALPLESAPKPGSHVVVMSHPVGRFFTFTQGMVTRRSRQHRDSHLQELLEISADFGPGSSGAPVVNARGNAVGWVDTLKTWPNPSLPDSASSPTLTFRECGVAEDVLLLVQQINARTSHAVPESNDPGNSGQPAKMPKP